MNTNKSTAPIEFRAIPGHPGYEADSDGNIWSLITLGDHRITDTRQRRLSACLSSSTGYLYVTARKSTTVHRLILLAFIGPCPPGHEACHNNGIRTDNRPSNLRWDTRKSNHNDKHVHGTWQGGENNPQAVLTEVQVGTIKVRLRNGETARDIAREYGMEESTIGYIRSGKLWKHVGEAVGPAHEKHSMNGMSMSLRAWARFYKVPFSRVIKRILKGSSLEFALLGPTCKGVTNAEQRWLESKRVSVVSDGVN
jgi:hypothetical protein